MTIEGTVVEPDAADRLILDEAAPLLEGATVLVVESLALAEAASAAGAASVAVWLDSAADAAVAATLGFEVAGSATAADVVLLRLPKSLRALEGIAQSIAATASAGVVVFAGGRLKYMTPRMNDVLLASFGRLDVSLARQKSRVLIAREPRVGAAVPAANLAHLTRLTPLARLTRLAELDLEVGSVGGVFAGDALDLGTRVMLEQFDRLPAFDAAIDLGCGTGILAAQLKRRRPSATVIASDVSAEAVASARETMRANELDVTVVHESALSHQADASVDLVVLNPPFHDGGAISTDLAAPLFEAAARVLRPGGRLWTVFNTSLAYRAELVRLVGETTQITRTAKFTLTESVRRS